MGREVGVGRGRELILNRIAAARMNSSRERVCVHHEVVFSFFMGALSIMPKQRRAYTPFELGVTTHFIKEKKPTPPATSWWTTPSDFSQFTEAARARDREMGWSADGRGGREVRTMYEDWKFTK